LGNKYSFNFFFGFDNIQYLFYKDAEKYFIQPTPGVKNLKAGREVSGKGVDILTNE
jgi:hypothetical protein